MAKRKRTSRRDRGGNQSRWPVLDFARGLALLAMVVYHFCFDLAWNGWITADLGEDWRWVAFRIPILGSFLFIAGMSLALAMARGQSERSYWRRVGIITAAALLVTAGSYAMFPDSFIYFGVLHAIALMSVLARPLLPSRDALFIIGIAIVVAGTTIAFPLFDRPPLHWIGLMTFKPRTEDYVPLFPWFGVFLIGAAAGIRLAQSVQRSASLSTGLAGWTPPRPLDWVRVLGRHTLFVYLVHQPILLGSMLLVRKLG
jgi:uncharacterized membrane protein